MLPNVRGLVRTGDGASILFELRGRTIFGLAVITTFICAGAADAGHVAGLRGNQDNFNIFGGRDGDAVPEGLGGIVEPARDAGADQAGLR